MVLTPPFPPRGSTAHVSTRNSVGANLARMLNARANGSACVSHVLRPKKNIPVQVRTENPMANHASCEGMDRPSQTSSSQANTRNKPVAGQTPRLFGQLTLALRGAGGFDRSCSHQSNIAAHGLTTDQTLPTKADR